MRSTLSHTFAHYLIDVFWIVIFFNLAALFLFLVLGLSAAPASRASPLAATEWPDCLRAVVKAGADPNTGAHYE